jgi:hypothetical protein
MHLDAMDALRVRRGVQRAGPKDLVTERRDKSRSLAGRVRLLPRRGVDACLAGTAVPKPGVGQHALGCAHHRGVSGRRGARVRHVPRSGRDCAFRAGENGAGCVGGGGGGGGGGGSGSGSCGRCELPPRNRSRLRGSKDRAAQWPDRGGREQASSGWGDAPSREAESEARRDTHAWECGRC